MTNTRLQLTLFVEESESESIEYVRKTFNPKQYELIKCHVTLCREDELTNIEQIIYDLKTTTRSSITINFGQAIRFSEGKGILLPALYNNKQFHELRKSISQALTPKLRAVEPHITLMHPRNSTCTDILFEQIKTIKLPSTLKFNKISLIEQVAGKKWKTLKEFQLL